MAGGWGGTEGLTQVLGKERTCHVILEKKKNFIAVQVLLNLVFVVYTYTVGSKKKERLRMLVCPFSPTQSIITPCMDFLYGYTTFPKFVGDYLWNLSRVVR